MVQTWSVIHTTERERAISTIVAAFSADPLLRWVYPDAATYFKAFPGVVDAFGGRAFDAGSAFSFDQPVAAALWLGPGVEPNSERMGELVEESVRPEIQEDLGAFVEKMAEYHPHEPHWYLPLIGVDPAYQSRGLGSALMAHALLICDKESLPAYLEATNLNNRRLYERHGFKVIGEIQAGGSPTIWPMLREPRRV